MPVLTLIDLPPQDEASRLFFERSPLGVRSLVFETPGPESASVSSLALPRAESPHPRSTRFESHCFSEAVLDGVEEIVPCRHHVRGQQRIIGLLLQFPKSRRACVGQIRLDCLEKALQARDQKSV